MSLFAQTERDRALWRHEYQSAVSRDYADTRDLDRWLLLAYNKASAEVWVNKHLEVIHAKSWSIFQDWMLVRPIWDLHDPFWLRIVTDTRGIHGQIYYEYVDLAPSSMKAAKELLHRCRRVRNDRTTHTHPDPINTLVQEGEESWTENSYMQALELGSRPPKSSHPWSASAPSFPETGYSAQVTQREQTARSVVGPRRVTDLFR